MPTKVVSFGFSEAAFITPGAVPVYTAIDGAQELDCKVEMDTVEVPGDDDIVAYWNHAQKGSLSFKGSVLDLDAVSRITGNTVVEDVGPPEKHSILFGTDAELESTEFMFRALQRAKDLGNGSGRDRYLYFFRCVGQINVPGMKYGDAAVVEINAKLLKSVLDEEGETIVAAMGREEYIEV